MMTVSHYVVACRQQLLDIIHAPGPPPKALAITKPAVNAPSRARSFAHRPLTSPAAGTRSARPSFRVLPGQASHQTRKEQQLPTMGFPEDVVNLSPRPDPAAELHTADDSRAVEEAVQVRS